MRFDFFWRTYNRDVAKIFRPENERETILDLPAETTLDAALQAALGAGMSLGDNRTGCYQIQSDVGIWVRPDGKSFIHRRGSAVFKTWEDLEKEELAMGLN